MASKLKMVPQQCQEADCLMVYRCKIRTEYNEIEAQCEKCDFDDGCELRENIEVLPFEAGTCPSCHQDLMQGG